MYDSYIYGESSVYALECWVNKNVLGESSKHIMLSDKL